MQNKSGVVIGVLAGIIIVLLGYIFLIKPKMDALPANDPYAIQTDTNYTPLNVPSNTSNTTPPASSNVQTNQTTTPPAAQPAAVTVETSTSLGQQYKSVFTAALAKPADFDGHYVVASWGCGSGCQSYGIIDKQTGKVYGTVSDDYGNTANYYGDATFNANRYSVSGNTFKVIGYRSIETYTFDNGKFTLSGTTPFPQTSGVQG